MKQVYGKEFVNESVDLDDTVWSRCKFKNCHLVTAGVAFHFVDSVADENCKWVFVGPAGAAFTILRDWLGWRPQGKVPAVTIPEGIVGGWKN